MRKSILIIIALILPLYLTAQRFEDNWKRIDKTLSNNQPRTALSLLSQIEQRATQDQLHDELLRTYIYKVRIYEKISPDSTRQALENLQRATQEQCNPILHALHAAALYELYSDYYAIDIPYSIAHRQQDSLRSAIFTPMAELAKTSATNYATLFYAPKGTHYTNDLLSIFLHNYAADNQNILARALNYYTKAQLSPQTLLTRLQLLRLQRRDNTLSPKDYLSALSSLYSTYKGLPANIETAITIDEAYDSFFNNRTKERYQHLTAAIQSYRKEKRVDVLRNALANMTSPKANICLSSNQCIPGQMLTLKANARHLEEVKVEILKFKGTTSDFLHLNPKERLKKSKRIRNLRFKFNTPTPYTTTSDSALFNIDQQGIYAITLHSQQNEPEWLFVSHVMPLIIKDGHGNTSIRPIDRTNGELIPTANLIQYTKDENNSTYHISRHINMANDSLIHPYQKNLFSTIFALHTPNDNYSAPFNFYGSGEMVPITDRLSAALFTDRSIYRPGQIVHASATIFRTHRLEQNVLKDFPCTITIRNTQYDTLNTFKTYSNGDGVVAAHLTLPTHLLPGVYHIGVEAPQHGLRHWQTIRVENYRRPTFEISLQHPTQSFKLGDSIKIQGTAQTFTQIPLAYASVRYNLKTSSFRFKNTPIQTGNTTCDANGKFSIPLRLAQHTDIPFAFASFRLEIEVTGNGGETQNTTLRWSAGNDRLNLRSSLTENALCKEHLPLLSLTAHNSLNIDPHAHGTLSIIRNKHTIKTIPFTTGEKDLSLEFLSDFPSGEYTLCAEAEDARIEHHITLFSLNDTHTPEGNALLYVLPSKHADSALIVISSGRQPAVAWLDLYGETTYEKHQAYPIDNRLLKIRLSYNDIMGDGARGQLSIVKKGTLLHHSICLKRHLPQKQLVYQWETFRSSLQPGATETWRLRITHPDGTPADASIAATLYDASLDALYPNIWHYDPNIRLRLPFVQTSINTDTPLFLYHNTYTPLHTTQLTPYNWRPQLFNTLYYTEAKCANDRLYFAHNEMQPAKILGSNNLTRKPIKQNNNIELKEIKTEENINSLRSNFTETAFFFPALHTDDNGVATLQFTIPQSTTEWRFRSFAHTKNMDYALFSDTIVARKQLMVHAQMPRFVRENDKVAIPIIVRNLTTNPQNGPILCTIEDVQTGKSIKKLSIPFDVDTKGEFNTTLHFEAKKYPEVVRVIVQALTNKFSDGESHMLAVLPDNQITTRTLPFAQTKAGKYNLRIDTLFSKDAQMPRRLIVETSANPTWYTIKALPTLLNADNGSAISIARSFFALSTAQNIVKRYPELEKISINKDKTHTWAALLNRNPELKQILLQETPWSQIARNEQEQLKELSELLNPLTLYSRQKTCIDRLYALQQADGGFQWFAGMPSNLHVTLRVAIMLQQEKCAHNDKIQSIIEKAYGYAEKEIHKITLQAKKEEPLTNIESDYLKLSLLLHKEADKDIRKLLQRMQKNTPNEKIETLATKAFILKGYHMPKADAYRKRLLEHTVHTPNGGITFDTFRHSTPYHQLIAQCTAIEALEAFNTSTDILAAMRLHLLQEKRVLAPNTPIVTALCIRALSTTKYANSLKALNQTNAYDFCLLKGKKVITSSTHNTGDTDKLKQTVGYQKRVYTGKESQATTLRLKKSGNDLSWGAVYAQYSEPTTQSKVYGKGLHVTSEINIWDNGKWTQTKSKQTLKEGTRVRIAIYLRADNNFNFVNLHLPRPAAFEPTNPLSRYVYTQHAYRAVRDAATDFFFMYLPKGNHLLYEEYYINRPGQYLCAPIKAQCLYAPEYKAQSESYNIRIDKK